MNRKQRRKKALQKAQQPRPTQMPGANVEAQAAALINQKNDTSDRSDSLVFGEVLVILLLAFLGLVPLGVALATNKCPFVDYILIPDKRSGVFSYASFWLSAAAALAAGRGVLRSKVANASSPDDSHYYWEGAVFLTAAAVCAAAAVSDHDSTPKISVYILATLGLAQIVVSGLALSRLRGREAELRRALILRVPLIVLMICGLAGYAWAVFRYAP